MSQADLPEMIQRAQQLQRQLAELQSELAARSYEATSGGGMVKASVSGALRVVSIEIEPALFESSDRDMIQDLAAAAVNAALARAQESVQQEMQALQRKLMGSVLPGGLGDLGLGGSSGSGPSGL